MKKTSVICLLLCVFMICTQLHIQSFATAADLPADDSSAAILSGCHSVDAVSTLLGTEKLTDNVKAAVVYESNSDTLMYAMNPDEQMHPASFVKILTALIAVERGNLTDTVTAQDSALSAVPFDAVSADIVSGEQLKLEDLLYCMLTGSANDAAVVIAEHISGSHSAFVREMNTYAQKLGCKGTVFTNAHGLHDDQQITTARDSARILAAAMKNETFRTIFTAMSYTVEATNKSAARELKNSNSHLDVNSRLYYDARVIGGRTGVTKDGRRCLASAAESNGMQLITIVMGSESVYEEDGYTAISVGGYKETTKLLDACFSGYKTAQILFENQALMQYPVQGGICDVIVAPSVSVSTVLPEAATAAELSYRYASEVFQAPIEKGQKLSAVQVWHAGICVAQADLYAMNAVAVAGADTDIQPGNGFEWPVALTVVLCILGGLALVIVLLRVFARVRIMIRKNRTRRYRRSRRRSR